MQDGEYGYTCTNIRSEREIIQTDSAETTGESTSNNNYNNDNDNKNIWVRNIPSSLLTKSQEKIQPPKPNIMREERRALAELRKGKSKIILTTDKGVSLVVMDREEYIRKAQALLDQPEYKSIPADPTTRYKNKLISILKSIKAECAMNEVTYREALSHRGKFTQVLWPAQST